jgi:hypothetical protein
MNAYNSTFGGQMIPGGCGSGISTFLGNDTNLDGGAPGTPVESYCFSPSMATLGTICAENAAGNTVQNAYGFNMMNPNGIYLPDGNFNNFIGCPVNGNWTITVRDNQGIDDGYIFQWGIYFNSSLYPESEGYANIVDTNWWSFDPTIISGLNGDTLIVVQPAQTGTFNYQFNVIDDFGCQFDTIVSFVVVEGPEIFPDTVTCNSTFQVFGTVSFDGGVWSSTDPEINFSNPNVENPLISASGPGTYTVSFLDNECSGSVSTEIQFLSDIGVDIPDATVCAGNNYLIAPIYSSTGTLETANYTISWNNGSSDTTLIANQPGNYVLTVSNACVTDSDSLLVYDQPTIFTDTLACNLTHQVVGTYAPNGGVWSSINSEISYSNVSAINPVINASMAGIYLVTFTDTLCQTEITSTVEFPPKLNISIIDTSICIGTNFNLIPIFNNVQPIQNGYINPINIIWENNTTDLIRVINAAGLYTATISNECYSKSATSTVVLKPCDIEVPNIINLSSNVGNDLFFVQYNGIAEFNCQIFNRWGNLIYEYSDPAGTWDGKTADGKPVTEGTYFYKIIGRFDGLSEDFVKHGFVVVKY